jgi:uncharacterized protein YjbI with pentapeptide repeats
MTSAEIEKVLDLHKKWCNNGQNGKKADLSGANLREADLHGVNLREADLCGADLTRADLREADLCGADLTRADLCGADLTRADLTRADLRGANLRGADFDFSCFPLWCGGSKFKCDTKLVYQLLAHICTLDFDDTEGIKNLIMPFAVRSHRAEDLGLREESK